MWRESSGYEGRMAGVNKISISISISTILGTIDIAIDIGVYHLYLPLLFKGTWFYIEGRIKNGNNVSRLVS